jgi:hypothetical protein
LSAFWRSSSATRCAIGFIPASTVARRVDNSLIAAASVVPEPGAAGGGADSSRETRAESFAILALSARPVSGTGAAEAASSLARRADNSSILAAETLPMSGTVAAATSAALWVFTSSRARRALSSSVPWSSSEAK